MMNRISPKHARILAIAPSTVGFGFAVLEEHETLVDWGIKAVEGDKNRQSLKKVGELILQYQPEVIVLQDCSTKDSGRAPRIRSLSRQIIALAKKHKVGVALFSREHVKQIFLADGKGSKHAIAEVVAQRFPEELGQRLPAKRQLWQSEDSRMLFFDAVALALTFQLKAKKQKA